MKKKLVCILLCFAMLLSGAMVTGCATSDDGTDTAETDANGNVVSTERSSITLSLWLPTKEGTTDEAVAAVEQAINRITQAEYDTAIKLYAIPEAEYDDVMKDRVSTIQTRVDQAEQDAINDRKQEIEDAKNGVTGSSATTGAADDNPNMDGDYSLVVPEAAGYSNVEKNQLDIFLIHGLDNYNYYADNYYLSALDEELAAASKSLKSYVYPDFFTAANIDGSTYCVPNNHAIGEYTYLLVNKDLAAAEYFGENDLTTLSECQEFIEDVAKYHKDVTPLYGNYAPSYYKYWSGQDVNSFSTLASRVLYSSGYEDVEFKNIFEFNNFTTNYYLYKSFVEKGYVSTSADVKEFGVGYVTCTAEEVAKYADDYYINVYHRPEGTKEDYLESSFAVSSFTKSVSRSMEIITLLNTDTELRTILQYGVEGTHWKYDEEDDSFIVKLSDDYKMNLLDTGNEYMTYPDYGVGLDYWETTKTQNLDSYCPITILFEDEYQTEENADLLAKFDTFNASIKSQIDGMSAEEFKSNISTLAATVNNNETFQKVSYLPADNDVQKGRTEENGWIAVKSISYLWTDFVARMTDTKS